MEDPPEKKRRADGMILLRGGRPLDIVKQGSWIFAASKNELTAILDNMPCGVAILRSPFGKVRFINKQIMTTLGYDLGDVPTSTEMAKRAHLNHRARSRAEASWKEAVRAGGGTRLIETTCKDGTVRTFEHRSVVLRKDLIISLWIDVTRREAAEAELRESEPKFASLFEKSSDAFLLFDDDRLVECNLAAQELFGQRDKERMLATPLGGFSPEKQPDGRLSLEKIRTIFKAAAKKRTYRCQWTAKTSDGKELPVELSIAVVALDNKNLFFIVAHDVSGWKKAQTHLIHQKVELERKVKERTSALSEINERLRREMKMRKKTERMVRRSREDLRSLSEYLQQIREQERSHIAREVHDRLGQSLANLKIDLAQLKNVIRSRDMVIGNSIRKMEKQVSDTMESVRQISRDLRPPMLDDLGLVPAVGWYLRDFEERTGIICTAAIDELSGCPDSETNLVIFRILQEAMTNVFRHAGATHVHVTLKSDAKQLKLQVKDNGAGISADQAISNLSLGILGIRERVKFRGGRSSFAGSPGKGTTVTVSIPVGGVKTLHHRRQPPVFNATQKQEKR